MRSKLFVPGSRTDLFAKALAGDADAISFDVEDSVPEHSKVRAREQIADFLRSGVVRDSAKLIIVRVNALDSAHFEGDLMAFACPRVALLNLPKAQCAADVRQAAAALEQRRAAQWRRPADRSARQHRDRAGPATGCRDRRRASARRRTAAGTGRSFRIHACRPSRLGQRPCRDVRDAHGVRRERRFAYDSAYPDVVDADGFRREAEQARQLGYVGKSCVHPKQVALANEIFGAETLDIDHCATHRRRRARCSACRPWRLPARRPDDRPAVRQARRSRPG